MPKTKAYYTTSCQDDYYLVQKLTPDLEMDGRPYKVSFLSTGTGVCSCVARKDECRHVQLVRKFIQEDKIGQHPPYDFDNDCFFEVSDFLKI